MNDDTEDLFLLNTQTYRVEYHTKLTLVNLIKSSKSIGNCLIYFDKYCSYYDKLKYDKYKPLLEAGDFEVLVEGVKVPCIFNIVRDDFILVKTKRDHLNIWYNGYCAFDVTLKSLYEYIKYRGGIVFVAFYVYLNDKDEWILALDNKRRVNLQEYVMSKGKCLDRSSFVKSCLFN